MLVTISSVGELPHGIQQRCRAVPIHPLAASGRIGQHLAPQPAIRRCAHMGAAELMRCKNHLAGDIATTKGALLPAQPIKEKTG